MKKLLLYVALLSLSGCGTRIVYRDPPQLPDLPPEIKAPCPGLDPVKDKSIGALALADVESSRLYARCQSRGDSAVNMYDAAQKARADYMAKKVELTKKK